MSTSQRQHSHVENLTLAAMVVSIVFTVASFFSNGTLEDILNSVGSVAFIVGLAAMVTQVVRNRRA